MAKIGILGGTFDPIHNGHLRLGREAYEQFGLDAVWFMPTGNPPHKKDHKITEGEMRERMVKLAIADTPYFLYSDFELRRRVIPTPPRPCPCCVRNIGRTCSISS